LIEEVLNKLLFKWPGCEEAVKIGTQKLGDKISVPPVRRRDIQLEMRKLTDPQEER
jgi:hypothetical protein